MARRIYKFIGNHTGAWRGCPERACRRARSCIAPSGDCASLPPGREPTPEDTARLIAAISRAMRAGLDDIDRQEAARGEAGK